MCARHAQELLRLGCGGEEPLAQVEGHDLVPVSVCDEDRHREAPHRAERILMDDTKSWQYPIARARGLLVYTSLLEIMGKRDEAAKYQSRWRELSGVS